VADRLRALAEVWKVALQAEIARTYGASVLETVRDDLCSLAAEAEAAERGNVAQALRRIAVLSEVWECLESEPDRREAAADVAGFCLTALRELAADGVSADSGIQASVCEEILCESDERWSDFLAPVDPSSAQQALAWTREVIDEGEVPQDNEPHALDPQHLISLFGGLADSRDQPASARTLPAGSGSRQAASLGAEPIDETPTRSGRSASASRIRPEALDERLRRAQEPALDLPSLPAQFDLDNELKEAFLADAGDLFERIEGIVVGVGSLNDSHDAIHELGCCLHTLKGAASSVGLTELARLVHEVEERLEQAGGAISPSLNHLLYQVVGYLEGLIELLRRGASAPHQRINQPLARCGETPESTLGPSAIQAGPSRAETEATPTLHSASARPGVESGSFPGDGCAQHASDETALRTRVCTRDEAMEPRTSGSEAPIRVPAARLDELMDLASELIVQGRFWLAQAESLRSFAATAQGCRNRLLGTLDRLEKAGLGRRVRVPTARGDPAEDLLAQLRLLAEQADDLSVLAGSAQATAAPMADRGDTLVRVSLQLWDDLQSLRIVSIRGLFQRLARVAHDAARVEGRQVEVVMLGEETSVDRAVQDKAFEPLLHVVRNAVGHGIEGQSDRIRAGKPASGRVTLEARREGNTLVIAVDDDGRGLDDDAILNKARRLGWLGPDEKPGRDQLHAFIFQPGFSTRSQANEISGRGVGMDVVSNEVARLRGTIDLVSRPGRGTRLTLRLPARVALEPALIVRVGNHPIALPAAQVERALAFEPADPSPDGVAAVVSSDRARSADVNRVVNYGDQVVPVVFAREMLGLGQPSPGVWPKLVIVRSGSRLVGLVVDTIEGALDLVIKPMGALLAGHPLVSGTSVSIDGEVITVLNSSGLERWLSNRTARGPASAMMHPARGPDQTSPEERTAVLVVDDSISVRRAVARQLSSLGLDVHEVSDGQEALGNLRGSRYGLVLTDLDMPKLDGFALLAEMRRSANLAEVPVIVASSRDDSKTRQRVLDLGARALLSKPVDPLELVRAIGPLLPGLGR
jgi:chemotaxis protein histidine kinase CheA